MTNSSPALREEVRAAKRRADEGAAIPSASLSPRLDTFKRRGKRPSSDHRFAMATFSRKREKEVANDLRAACVSRALRAGEGDG